MKESEIIMKRKIRNLLKITGAAGILAVLISLTLAGSNVLSVLADNTSGLPIEEGEPEPLNNTSENNGINSENSTVSPVDEGGNTSGFNYSSFNFSGLNNSGFNLSNLNFSSLNLSDLNFSGFNNSGKPEDGENTRRDEESIHIDNITVGSDSWDNDDDPGRYATPDDTPEAKLLLAAADTLICRGDGPIKPGTGLKVLRTSWLNSYPQGFMSKVDKYVQLGYNVVFINTVNGEDHVILIPAGTPVNLKVDWSGPAFMSQEYIDITAAVKAADGDLPVQNALTALAERGYVVSLVDDTKSN